MDKLQSAGSAMSTPDDPIRNEADVPAARPAFQSEDELDWLKRRRDVLLRAIAEMRSHNLAPQLSLTTSAELPGLIGWAERELDRVRSCIATMEDAL